MVLKVEKNMFWCALLHCENAKEADPGLHFILCQKLPKDTASPIGSLKQGLF